MRLLFRASVIVLEAHDVMFADISAALRLDDLKRTLAGVAQTAFGRDDYRDLATKANARSSVTSSASSFCASQR